MSSRQRILLFDVESAPMLAFIWRAKTEYVNVDAITHETFLLTWAAKWWGEEQMHRAALTSSEAKAQDDSRIVGKLADLVRQADGVVAHNAVGFDIPKLNGRVLLDGLEPLGPVRSIDTLTLARRSFGLASNKLDYLAQKLEVGAKLPTGFDLWRRAYNGEAAAIREMDRYCQQDVLVLEGVFNAVLPHVKGPLARLVDADYEWEDVCPTCGSDDLERRGYARTNASTFRRYRCKAKGCGRWSRSRRSVPEAKLAKVPL